MAILSDQTNLNKQEFHMYKDLLCYIKFMFEFILFILGRDLKTQIIYVC